MPCSSELMAPELGGGCTSESQSAVANSAITLTGVETIPCVGSPTFLGLRGALGEGISGAAGAGACSERSRGVADCWGAGRAGGWFFKAFQEGGEEE